MAEQVQMASRSYGGLTAEQRRDDRRARLLAAGLELYGTQGYAATTIEQLCKASRITARHFYESFPSQADLFRALFDQIFDEVDARVLASISEAEASADNLIRAGLTIMFHDLLDDPRRVRVVCTEVYGAPDGVKLGAAAIGRLTAEIEFYSGLLVELGIMEADRVQLRSIAIAGALQELLLAGLPDGLGIDIDDLIDIAVETFERLAVDHPQQLDPARVQALLPDEPPALHHQPEIAPPHRRRGVG